MTELAVLLGAAALGHGVARASPIPPAPLMVAAGFVAAAAGWITPGGIQEILVLSAIVLLFSAGTELAPERVGHQWRGAIRVGAAQFAALGLAGLAAALALGFRGPSLAYIALATAASSTLVGIRVLQRRRQLFEPFGRLVAGVLLFQDAVVILALPLLGSVGEGIRESLTVLAGSAGLAAVAWILHRRLGPAIGDRLEVDREASLLGFLALLFVFLGAGGALGVPAVTAAFLAGFALSGFPVSTVARTQLASLNHFFSALFFAALGSYLVAPTPAELVGGLVLALVVLGVTPLVVGIVGEREGFSAGSALTAGLLLSQTSEFSLVVGLQGLAAGILAPDAFTVIALATVVTMALTPLLSGEAVARWLVRLHPFRKRGDAPAPPADHVVLLGCGSNGATVLDLLLTHGAAVAVVEEDPAVADSLRKAGLAAYRGDASDPRVLAAAGADRARVVV
ncbi:MAG TPA: cation:proton antiporter, partial [Longimicrobiales bacterium]|nr:cation:proton antiporter [Longimicrobiales bacterium]